MARRGYIIKIGIAVLFLSLCLAANAAAIYLKRFTFDDPSALDNWNSMVLNGQVDYRLMKQGSEGYVLALSEKACSALYYRVGFKLNDYPYLSWRWRVLKFPDLSSAKTAKDRDDYAARVYVIFPFLNFSLSKFIEYVWSEDLPEGTVMDSPLASNVKIIVLRRGRAPENEWVNEKRNVYDDYLKVFGKKPDIGVGAIAMMCDADNTKSSSEALFDDIVIESQAGLAKGR